MTYSHGNPVLASVRFGVLPLATVSVVLNAALRRGLGAMGMVLSNAVLIWMLIDLPVRDALTTWAVFAVVRVSQAPDDCGGGYR